MAKDKKKQQDTGGGGAQADTGVQQDPNAKKEKDYSPTGGYSAIGREMGATTDGTPPPIEETFLAPLASFFSSFGDNNDADESKKLDPVAIKKFIQEHPDKLEGFLGAINQVAPAQMRAGKVMVDLRHQNEQYKMLNELGGNVRKTMEMVTGNDVAKASVSPRQPTMSTRGAPQMMQAPPKEDMTKQLVTGTVAQVLSNAMSAMTGASKGTATTPFTAQTQAAKAAAQEVQRKRIAEAKVAASVRDKNFKLITQYYDSVDEALQNYDDHFTELEKKRMDNMANIFNKGVELYQDMLGMRKDLAKSMDDAVNKAFIKQAEFDTRANATNVRARNTIRAKKMAILHSVYKQKQMQRHKLIKANVDAMKNTAAACATGFPMDPPSVEPAMLTLAEHGHDLSAMRTAAGLVGQQARRELFEGINEYNERWFDDIEPEDRNKIHELMGLLKVTMLSGQFRKGGIRNLAIDVLEGNTTINDIRMLFNKQGVPGTKHRYYTLDRSALAIDPERYSRYFASSTSGEGLLNNLQFGSQKDTQAFSTLVVAEMCADSNNQIRELLEAEGAYPRQDEED